MDQQAALKFFELSSAPDFGLLAELRRKKRFDIEEAILVAPTEALKRKYRDELSELETAFQVLYGEERSLPAGMNVTRVRMRSGGKLYYRGEEGSGGPAARPGVVPGDVLSGRFEIQHLLGAGGIGASFEALDRSTGRRVALKVFLPNLFSSPDVVNRFNEWSKKIVQVVHASSVRVTDVMQDGDFRYLVSEFVEGRTLGEWMRERRGKPIKFDEITSLLSTISGPLQYLHDQGITHGSLRPQNVFLLDDGGVKLSDNGQGSFLSPDELQKIAIVSGGNQYLAPELRDKGEQKPSIDQYGLGMIAYELVSGSDAASGKLSALKKLRPDTPDGLAQAIDRALETDPAARFPKVIDFAGALGAPPVETKKEIPAAPSGIVSASSGPISSSGALSPSGQVRGGAGLNNAVLMYVGLGIVALGLILLGIKFFGGSSKPATIATDNEKIHQLTAAWSTLQKKREGISSGLLDRYVSADDFRKLEKELSVLDGRTDRELNALIAQVQEYTRKADDASVQPRLDSGMALLKQGDKEGALKEFQDALAVAPDSSMAHMNLAFSFIASDRPLDAIRELEESVRLDPKNVRSHMALGKIYRSRGRIGEASQHLRKVVEIDPGNKDAQKLLQELEY